MIDDTTPLSLPLVAAAATEANRQAAPASPVETRLAMMETRLAYLDKLVKSLIVPATRFFNDELKGKLGNVGRDNNG